MNIRSTFVRAAGAVTLVGTITLGACTHDQLLGVQSPDIISPDVAQSVAGAQTFRVSALGNFARFIGGDLGGGSPLGLNLTGSKHLVGPVGAWFPKSVFLAGCVGLAWLLASQAFLFSAYAIVLNGAWDSAAP